MDTKSLQSGLRGMDDLLLHPGRLGICFLLAGAEQISFMDLKRKLGLTDGNLGAQLAKLERMGYLKVRKTFVNRKPVSFYHLTQDGEEAVDQHLDAMRRIVGQMQAKLDEADTPCGHDRPAEMERSICLGEYSAIQSDGTPSHRAYARVPRMNSSG